MEGENSGRIRVKRVKLDKGGRSSAFERLKSLKGKKNKCDVGELENVYDEVDEKEYSKRVLQRQDEDWLEGPGDGYIEDGREIFDEDDDDDEIICEAPKRSKSKKKNVSEKSFKSSKNILQMVANMSAKKKKAEDDNVLDNLVGELSSEPKPRCESPETLSSEDYLKSLGRIQNYKPKTIPETKSPNVTVNCLELDPETSRTDIISRTEEIDFKKDGSIKVVGLEGSDGRCTPVNDTPVNETFEDTNLAENSEDEVEPGSECLNDLNMDALAGDFEETISLGESSTPSTSEMSEDLLMSGWETNSLTENIQLETIDIDKSDFPIVEDEKGQKVFRFFWWDAYEDPFKQAGLVYLFGKAFHEGHKVYVSCCLCVENIERKIYLLPREKRFDLKNETTTDTEVTVLDVYEEFNDKIANRNKIMNFKCRKVVRKYAFELRDVPAESEYLEVKYPASYPKLSQDLTGETFSRVFGTNTSSLESLLLDQKIKGPCWLEVRNPQNLNVSCSWCQVEARCVKPEDVTVVAEDIPPPPLLVMTVNIRCVANTKNKENEVVMIGCLIHNEYSVDKPAPNPPFRSHFCSFTRPAGLTWPQDFEHLLNKYQKTEAIVHESERSLLNHFLTKLNAIDPDVVVGHDLYGFTLDTLMLRIQNYKMANWSRVGRLKRTILPQMKGKQAERNLMCGRLVCDLNICARELIRARSYDLDSLCKQILNLKEDARQDFSSEEIIKKYGKTPTIIRLINATMDDSSYILKLMYELNVLPLALHITNIAGNLMSRTLLGGRSERNEFLLLHAFTEKEYLVPDKNYSKKAIVLDEEAETAGKSSRKKPQYTGGLVLEPKRGFYDKLILLMDFNSLYPSIIQEYNICFTTVDRTEGEDAEAEAPIEGLPLGILPTEIQKLVESRRQVKAFLKTPDLTPEQCMQYNIRQMALKLTANSMYGCLGFSHSRFYAKPLAALVTSKGREILMNTKDIVQKMNFDVIYGDTDSIMINTNSTDYEDVFNIGHNIKKEINKLYKYVELEVDGVFKYMLLLKKKKYAAVVLSKNPSGEVVETQEYKGIDIVRRDWCQLSAEVGGHILKQILSDLNPDERVDIIREHLERIADDLRSKTVPVPLLVIKKQLNKNPDEYPANKSLPHLQVALRINSRGGKKLKAGDVVPYVICDDGSSLPAVQRAYHVDELKASENLLIDVDYYLSQQIHPVVSRLCEPIPGADGAFIAECLGLNPTSYRKVKNVETERQDEAEEYTLLNDIKSFQHCDKFAFLCGNEQCRTTIFLDSPMRGNRPALSTCRNPSCSTPPARYLQKILNTLNQSIRKYVAKLYENWMVCEDPTCPNRTQRVPMSFTETYPICSLCKKAFMYKEYGSADLYYQLKYFEFIFDIKSLQIELDPEVEKAYDVLYDRMNEVLEESAYRILDFGKIFKFACTAKNREELLEEFSL